MMDRDGWRAASTASIKESYLILTFQLITFVIIHVEVSNILTKRPLVMPIVGLHVLYLMILSCVLY